MTKRIIRNLCIVSSMAICLVFTMPLIAQDEYRARLMTTGGPVQDKMVNIRILIEDYTTVDEVRNLHRILSEKGINAFLDAFRNTDKGVINFKGARGLNLRINATNSETTEKGRKIFLFTERQSWDTSTYIRVSGKYLFMAIELEIDNNWKIKGKFYPAANIEISKDGRVTLQSYQTPLMLMGVRKVN